MANFSSLNAKCNTFALFFVGSIMIFGVTTIDARRLGGQKCTWGPSYWCKNIRQASAVSRLILQKKTLFREGIMIRYQ